MPIRSDSRSPAPGSPSLPLGHTPSLKYQPASKADRKTDEKLSEIVKYRERTGAPHPDLPMKPSGIRTMTPEEAAATRLFRERYHMAARKSNIEGTRFDFDRHEYCQTYRREGEDVVANQDELIVGGFNFVTPQAGRFPPGTCVDIHSHPNLPHPDNAMPSDLDQRVAHQLRTNALHRPGTRIDGAIMYYPPNDTFYGYTGQFTGITGRKLEFRQLVDTQHFEHLGAPTLDRQRRSLSDAPPNRYKPYRPAEASVAPRTNPSSSSRPPARVAPESSPPDRLEVAPWEAFYPDADGRPASANLPPPQRPNPEHRPASLSGPLQTGPFRAMPPPSPREADPPAPEQPVRYSRPMKLHQPKPRRPGDAPRVQNLGWPTSPETRRAQERFLQGGGPWNLDDLDRSLP